MRKAKYLLGLVLSAGCADTPTYTAIQKEARRVPHVYRARTSVKEIRRPYGVKMIGHFENAARFFEEAKAKFAKKIPSLSFKDVGMVSCLEYAILGPGVKGEASDSYTDTIKVDNSLLRSKEDVIAYGLAQIYLDRNPREAEFLYQQFKLINDKHVQKLLTLPPEQRIAKGRLNGFVSDHPYGHIYLFSRNEVRDNKEQKLKGQLKTIDDLLEESKKTEDKKSFVDEKVNPFLLKIARNKTDTGRVVGSLKLAKNHVSFSLDLLKSDTSRRFVEIPADPSRMDVAETIVYFINGKMYAVGDPLVAKKIAFVKDAFTKKSAK